ncbi:MAG: polyprenol monophosphomannose synthase, partial [Nitrospinae bacterium]|nr:polyprenol monophosphomannose synthase [Nitrospinota bacterium]
IPTYNESENIGRLIDEILDLPVYTKIVVVDDNSPDGTADVVKNHPEFDKRVYLLLRETDKGRGRAGIAGFQYALEAGADYIVEMDADFSHHPKYIPQLVQEMENADIVIGSRGVKGGYETGRSLARQWITKFANFYIRLFMGIKGINDCTAGFRCFKREVLEKVRLEKMESVGPSIVEEVLYGCCFLGYTIKEIPICFEDRTEGESTKNLGEYIDTAICIIKFRLRMNADFFKT